MFMLHKLYLSYLSLYFVLIMEVNLQIKFKMYNEHFFRDKQKKK